MLEFISKLTKLRDKVAKTELRCETCGEVVQVIDIEQHVKEKHWD